MATKFVKFNPDNEAAAEAYVDFLEAGMIALGVGDACVPWPQRYEESPAPGIEAGSLWRDVNGNFVVGWFGPPFALSGQTVEPITGDEEARALGVLVETPEWMQFEE